jgi:hypothetical protein
MLAPASAPLHDGLRDYGADPDDHAWEIARNPAWPISPGGLRDVFRFVGRRRPVTFDRCVFLLSG